MRGFVPEGWVPPKNPETMTAKRMAKTVLMRYKKRIAAAELKAKEVTREYKAKREQENRDARAAHRMATAGEAFVKRANAKAKKRATMDPALDAALAAFEEPTEPTGQERTQFKPGAPSANPNGRPRNGSSKRNAKQIFSRLDDDTFAALKEIINDDVLRLTHPREVIAACALQLSYSHGKPPLLLGMPGSGPNGEDPATGQPVSLLSILTMAHELRGKNGHGKQEHAAAQAAAGSSK
jgi:hypothetical protein